jgi:XTP/dITP diphosphohydrolase
VSAKAAGVEKRARLSGRLVVATHNAGKLWEIRELLRPYRVEAVGVTELNLDEPEETGATFRDNAALKAEAAARVSGIVALADDSGLCVDALDGAPGIYSARWAGGGKDFGAAMGRVEREIRALGAPPPWRASFVSVLALAWPHGALEMSSEMKHGIPADGSLALSHRARAFQKLARARL